MELLSTLGPSSLNEQTLKKLDLLGVSMFRINLSHTEIKDLENELVKMIDDEFNGNQNFKKIVMSSAFCSENDNIVSDNFKIDKKQTFGIIPPVGGG